MAYEVKNSEKNLQFHFTIPGTAELIM